MKKERKKRGGGVGGGNIIHIEEDTLEISFPVISSFCTCNIIITVPPYFELVNVASTKSVCPNHSANHLSIF